MSKITFPDKVEGPEAYITAGDVNMIKSVVNDNDAEIRTLIADLPASLPASDVALWAKQPNKPAYNFSELLTRPTTIAGYGITDIVNFPGYATATPIQSAPIGQKGTSLLVSRQDHVHPISIASGATTGLLAMNDWNTFNNKQDKLSGNGYLKLSGTDILYDNSVYNALTANLLTVDWVAKSLVSAGLTTTNGLRITNGTKFVNLIVDADGKLSIDKDVYSLGDVSGYGAGSTGGGGTGLVSQVFGYSNLGQTFNDSDLTNTFNAFTTNSIHNRLVSVENAGYITSSALPLRLSQLINDLGNYGGFVTGTPWTGLGYITASSLPTKLSQLINDSNYSTVSYVNQKVADLVNGAPASLDALNELANALGNDPNFATTVTNLIGTKQPQLNGLGFIKSNGTTISYDNSTYLTTGVATATYLTKTDAVSIYLPLTGGMLSGALIVNAKTTTKGLTITNGIKSVNLTVDANGYLSVDNGLYSTDFLSAYGASSGGGSGIGSGLVQTVYNYTSLGSAFDNANLTDTFNAYTINQINSRLVSVESGSATSVVISGSGNALTSITKAGNLITANLGETFQPLSSAINTGNIASQSVNFATTANYANALNGSAHTNGSDGWFRSNGQAGWYSQDYAVGIYATQSYQVRTYNGASFLSEGYLSGADVISRGNVGFHNDAYFVGVPNPIWSFGNALGYGIAYYQGSTGEGIGFHFGNIDVPPFKVSADGNVVANFFTGNGSGLTGTASGLNVNYATNSSKLYSTDGGYAFNSGAPYYGYLTYKSAVSRWRFAVSPATPSDVEVSYADNAGNAGNADTVGGYSVNENLVGGTIVKRTIDGYINASYFNSSRGVENSSAESYLYDVGDGYMRKKSLSNVKNEIVTSGAVINGLGFTPVNQAGDYMIGTMTFRKSTPIGTSYNNLGIQMYSDDGTPVGIGFHRGGYSQCILEHSSGTNGLIVREGTIGSGALVNFTAGQFYGTQFNGSGAGLNGTANDLRVGSSYVSNILSVTDNRGADRQPDEYASNAVTPFFNNSISGDWMSGLNVAGWSAGSYNSWQLIGGSTIGAQGEWYFREGLASFGAVKRIWHEGNSNLLSVDWNAKILSASGKIKTNECFKTTSPVAMCGDYDETGTADKVIWTIGYAWASVANAHGLGYTYNNINGFGHSLYMGANGSKMIQFSLETGYARYNGLVTMKGLAIIGASGGYTTGDIAQLNFGLVDNNFGYIKSPFGDKFEFGAYHGYKFKTSRGTGSGIDAFTIDINGNSVFNGNITATGEMNAFQASDFRLKKNINSLGNSLDIINQLNPVSYNWNKKAKELNSAKTDKTDVGLIAQELKNVLPNLVHDIYSGAYLSVDYIKLIPYLIGAIQGLTTEINTLKGN